MAGLQQINQAMNLVPNATRYFRTSQEKTTFINLAQDDYFKELAGAPFFMGRGGPVAPINFQQTGLLNQKLTKFYKQYPMQEAGFTLENEPIWAIDGLTEGRTVYDVKLILPSYPDVPVPVHNTIPDNLWRGRVNSPIVPPSTSDSVSKYYSDTQYLILPNPETASCYVLLLPLPCLIVLNPDLTYNATDSIDLEWDMSAVTSIFTRALVYAGVNIANPMVEQIATNLSRINV